MDDLQPGIAALGRWAGAARLAIGVFAVVLLATIVSYVFVLVAELRTASSLGISVYSPVLAVALGATNLLLALFFLLAAVPIAAWIYRAHANLKEAQLSELRYSPAWAVGSFFVPLVNFVVPFAAMRELHNRSHGAGPWLASEPVGDVTSWWTCHIAAVVVSTVTTFVALLATVPNLYVVQPPGVNTGLVIFSLVLLAGSAFFLFRTIGAVTSSQRHMMHLDQAQVFG
jgi:hypothetical protein